MLDWGAGCESGEGRFIADGPICWDTWLASDKRLVFLMKEACDLDLCNEWKDSEYRNTALARHWSLPSLIRQTFAHGDQEHRTWQNLALWSDAMHRFDRSRLPIHEIADPEFKTEALASLSRSAIVNLKKYDGASSSDKSDLAAHLQSEVNGRNNAEWLAKQLRILQPDWVICCSTWDLVKEALGDAFSLTNPPSRKTWAAAEHADIVWYDYWHPAWHSNSPFLLVNGIWASRFAIESVAHDR